MKSVSFILLAALFVVSAIWTTGCTGQGQTAAELHRNRVRARVDDIQAMHDDMERILLIDRPSRLTELSVR